MSMSTPARTTLAPMSFRRSFHVQRSGADTHGPAGLELADTLAGNHEAVAATEYCRGVMQEKAGAPKAS